jgi:hypothetical protein
VTKFYKAKMLEISITRDSWKWKLGKFIILFYQHQNFKEKLRAVFIAKENINYNKISSLEVAYSQLFTNWYSIIKNILMNRCIFEHNI